MSATITWSIVNLERRIDDGIVIAVHWQAIGVEEFEGESYSYNINNLTAVEEPPAEGYEVVPYDDLTEEIVLNWIWNDGVYKEEIEEQIQDNINRLKFPVIGSGIPW